MPPGIGNLDDLVNAASKVDDLLRASGIADDLLPIYREQVLGKVGQQARKLVDPDVARMVEGVERAAAAQGPPPAQAEDLAFANGLNLAGTAHGFELRAGNAVVGRFRNREAADRFLNDFGLNESALPNLTPSDLPLEHVTRLRGGPIRIQKWGEMEYPYDDEGPEGFMRGVRHLLSGRFITNRATFFKNVESEKTFGNVHSEFYLPLQKGALAAWNEINLAKREGLANRTFRDELFALWKAERKLTPAQREDVVRYLETMSPDEVIQRGFSRPMSPEEIQLANFAREKGIQSFPVQIIKQRRLTKEMMDDPAFKAATEGMGETERLKLAMAARGIPENVQEVMLRLDEGIGLGPERFSSFAVSRLFSAMNGGMTRAEFARGMSPQQLQVAAKLEAILNESFRNSRIDPKRFISGYYPHMREYVEVGAVPEWFGRELPEEAAFFADRFRQGEWDTYAMEPSRVALRHVTNLFKKQHLDPLLPKVNKLIRNAEQIDGRMAIVMKEYLNELYGRPHTSFKKVTQAINNTFKHLGINFSESAVRNFINTGSGLVYKSLLPFRPWMILRNFYIVMHVMSRTSPTGFQHGFTHGLTRESVQLGLEKGIIRPNAPPIHFNDDIFEPLMSRFRATPMGNFGEVVDKATDFGMRGITGTDNKVRLISWRAVRHDIMKARSRLMKGEFGDPTSGEAYERFKEAAHIKQFHEADEKIFDDLYKKGMVEEGADYLGKQLGDDLAGRFGFSNHPQGWGSVFGRVFGQFGSWGLQYKDFLVQGITRGTVKDRVQFAMTTAAINAVPWVATGVTGYNFHKWSPVGGILFTGGPYFHAGVDVHTLISGSDQEQAIAANSLMRWLSPATPFVPLTGAAGDFVELTGAFSGNAQQDALMRAVFGVRPNEQ